MSALRVAQITSECVPFVKSGGLADAVGGLSRALAADGATVDVVLPKYRGLETAGLENSGVSVEVPGPGGVVHAARALTGTVEGFRVVAVDLPEHFDRPGLYGIGGIDHPDNLARFATFVRAALVLLRRLDRVPDVVHAHDWQAALLPVLVRTGLGGDAAFADVRTVLTLHNLGYQGLFPAAGFPDTGLGWELFTPRLLEFHGQVNLLKGGIVAADAVTTVSPTYAREILAAGAGFGLEGVLADRARDLHGILNGIDEERWDPSRDPHIPVRYRASAIQGKGRCKSRLLEELELEADGTVPLVGIVSRLVGQKGIDLVTGAVPELLGGLCRWAILGTGMPENEAEVMELAAGHPGDVAAVIGFDEPLARRIIAGSDYLLMPSRFEPCGLNQMYAQRYGTVPVVRAVGGLADTVIDVDEKPGEATGVTFAGASVPAVVTAMERALGLYRRRGVWGPLRRRGMETDFSWKRSAARYASLYHETLSSPRPPIPAGP